MKASAFEMFISSIIRKNPKKKNKSHSRHTSTRNIMRVGNSQISKHSKSKSIFSSPKNFVKNSKTNYFRVNYTPALRTVNVI